MTNNALSISPGSTTPVSTETTVTPVTSVEAEQDSPKLFELSPNNKKEPVEEVTVTSADEETTTPSVLVPSDELTSVSIVIRRNYLLLFYDCYM